MIAVEGATGGFVVTSGIFTQEAQIFAQGRNIELIDGSALAAMIDKTQSTIRMVTPTTKEVSSKRMTRLRSRSWLNPIAPVAAALW